MRFELEEMEQRVQRAQQMMSRLGLDYLLVFEPENVTYLTGFYTEGYQTSFQAAIVPAEGSPTAIVRVAERFHFDSTAAWPNNTVYWSDGEQPHEVMLRALREVGVTGRAGFEGRSWRAPYSLMAAVKDGAPDLTWIDVDDAVSALRFVKSPAEVDLHRQAARAVDAMHAAVAAQAAPGVWERELAITATATGFRSGSDYVDGGPLAGGERGQHIHSWAGDRVLDEQDLVFAEMTAAKHGYHSRSMRTIIIGQVDRRTLDIYDRIQEAQLEALATVRAGVNCRVPDRMIREAIVGTGWVDHYPNKTFYGLGFMLLPNTYERLEVTPTADFDFEAGMVFHAYVSTAGLNVSETIVVTDTGYERLTQGDRALTIR